MVAPCCYRPAPPFARTPTGSWGCWSPASQNRSGRPRRHRLITDAGTRTARRHIGRDGHDGGLGPVATTFLAHGEGAAPLGTGARGQLDGAATVLASAQRRIPDMIPRLTVPSKAARGHLERAILPAAAVYLELSDRLGQDRARKLTAACLDSDAERGARVLHLLDRTPWLFPVLRRSGRRMMRRDFSPPAFGVRWAEDSAQRMRFGLDHLRFVRAGTLAQGCDRCDFCFERRPARGQRSAQGAAPWGAGLLLSRRALQRPRCRAQRPAAAVRGPAGRALRRG